MADRIVRRGDAEAVRLQEVAAGEYAEEVYVRDAWSAAVALGRAYLLCTERLNLGLAGAITAIIRNPAGSGRIVTVLGVSVMVTNTGWATMRRNPTGNLPTTVRTAMRVNPNAGEAPSSELLADTGTGELTGGDLGPVVGIPGDSRVEISPLGIPLAPGESIGLSSSFGAAADLAGTAYVIEEPL